MTDLVEQHEGWARATARAMAHRLPRSFDLRELESMALVGLWKAAQRWDPVSYPGVPFRAFAHAWVRNQVLMGVRRREWIHATTEQLPAGAEAPHRADHGASATEAAEMIGVICALVPRWAALLLRERLGEDVPQLAGLAERTKARAAERAMLLAAQVCEELGVAWPSARA